VEDNEVLKTKVFWIKRMGFMCGCRKAGFFCFSRRWVWGDFL